MSSLSKFRAKMKEKMSSSFSTTL